MFCKSEFVKKLVGGILFWCWDDYFVVVVVFFWCGRVVGIYCSGIWWWFVGYCWFVIGGILCYLVVIMFYVVCSGGKFGGVFVWIVDGLFWLEWEFLYWVVICVRVMLYLWF